MDAPGFKKFLRPGLVVQVAETARVDAILQVGASTDSGHGQRGSPCC